MLHGVRVKQLVALIICAVIYWNARLPAFSESDRERLAAPFSFQAWELPASGAPQQTERSVNSKLSRIASWISSIGASVCIGDLDRDGLANDLCLVDPRTDQVLVMPVPDTGARYPMFVLSFDRLVGDSPGVRVHDAQRMAPTGARIADLNEDGRLDVVVCFWGRPPLAFIAQERLDGVALHRSGYRAVEIAPTGDGWYSSCLTVADIDGDGHHDLVVGNYDADNSPKLGEGGDVSHVMQDSMSRAYNGGRNRFLLRHPAETTDSDGFAFVDADPGLPSDVLTGWTLAVGAADMDHDLLPEIYFANDFGPDRLLHNRSKPGRLSFAVLDGKKHFTTPNSKVLGRDSFKGMGVDFADINRDHLPDFLVSNIAGSWALEESHFLFVSTGRTDLMTTNHAPYEDLGEELGVSRSGWGWDVKFADMNNDGVAEIIQAMGFLRGRTNRWPELHELAMGNDGMLSNPRSWPRFRTGEDDLSGDQHNPFYVRDANGRYCDVAKQIGLATPYVTRGIATADCDGDGDLDFAIANQWATSQYFKNQGSHPPALVLDVAMVAGDRELRDVEVSHSYDSSVRRTPAYGATVLVRSPGGDQSAFVDGGNGHSGARSPTLHFGLGSEVKYGQSFVVEIQWRDRRGKKQSHQASIELTKKTVYVTLPGKVNEI